jgi:hypothetical protein
MAVLLKDKGAPERERMIMPIADDTPLPLTIRCWPVASQHFRCNCTGDDGVDHGGVEDAVDHQRFRNRQNPRAMLRIKAFASARPNKR